MTATTILAEHVRLGRILIRTKQHTLDDLAEKWGLDRPALWDALAGDFPEVAEPPLMPSEALDADPRNAKLSQIENADCIVPTRGADGKTLCGVPGCGRPHRARGYCMTHFKRISRDGDPQVDTPISDSPRETGRACATPGCPRPVLTRRSTVLLEEAREYCGPCYRNYRERQKRADGRRREVVFA